MNNYAMYALLVIVVVQAVTCSSSASHRQSMRVSDSLVVVSKNWYSTNIKAYTPKVFLELKSVIRMTVIDSNMILFDSVFDSIVMDKPLPKSRMDVRLLFLKYYKHYVDTLSFGLYAMQVNDAVFDVDTVALKRLKKIIPQSHWQSIEELQMQH